MSSFKRGFKIGDIVINEYGNTGKIVELNPVDECAMEVFDYGIKGDIDWCSIKKLRFATAEEIVKSFEIYETRVGTI